MISMNLARNAALVVATGRVALGVTALLRPSVPARPWVGAALAAGPAGQVFGRALGGRDLGLGLGALLALRRPDSSAVAGWVAAGWVAGGALADGADVLATVAAWPALPRWGRLGILGLAGGATAVGVLTAVTLAARSRFSDAEVPANVASRGSRAVSGSARDGAAWPSPWPRSAGSALG